MKEETPQHPKMESFAAFLDIPLVQAIGHMELLFHFTAKFSPRGDIGKFTDKVIASKCLFLVAESARSPVESARIDESVRFINALIDANWLEKHPEFRLVVHDWSDHCPEYVRKRLDRSGEAFWDKVKPYSTTKIQRTSSPVKRPQIAESERSPSGGHADDNGVLPNPTEPNLSKPSSSLAKSPPSRGPQTTKKHKNPLDGIDTKLDIIKWMAKVAPGKWSNSAKDFKDRRGPHPKMEAGLRDMEREDGPIVRKWWLEFIDIPDSDNHQYPYGEFMNVFRQKKLGEAAEAQSLREKQALKGRMKKNNTEGGELD